MRLLIIDNYDSFTFNLRHMCEPYISKIDVIRNDQIIIDNIINYDKIIISPGPGLPDSAGVCLELIKNYYRIKPILGICLGAQAIAKFFGAKLFNLNKVMHGKKSTITILDSNDIIYKNIPRHIDVGRYHSWAIDLTNHPELIITSVDHKNIVMSFKHKFYSLTGIQYHPESILTEFGQDILINWLTD